MLTRRNLFKLFPAIGALAVPAAAITAQESEVKPIIFEHTCDGGWSSYADDWHAHVEEEERKEGRRIYYRGCGTKFQWHFGVAPYCPKCGWAYSTEIRLIKRGIYRVVQGNLPDYDRE